LLLSSRLVQPEPQQVSPEVHDEPPWHVHELFVHPLEPVGEQRFAQVTDWPQLLVAVPHDLPLQAAVLSGVQHVSFARQTWVPGHDEQVMVCPQLLVAVVLHLPWHGVTLSGVQQVLPMHTSFDDEQLAVPPEPQATVCPQLFVAVPHVLPAHVVATGSGTQPHAPASLHVSPPSQPPQLID